MYFARLRRSATVKTSHVLAQALDGVHQYAGIRISLCPKGCRRLPASSALHATRARLYETVRTAHLERAHQLEPAAILYRRRRYDFDESVADGLELRHASSLSVLRLLLTPQIREVEINEPLSNAVVYAAAGVLGLELRRLLGRGRATVTTYAIENLRPQIQPKSGRGLKAMLRALANRALSRIIWRRLDRIVYGTDAARALYHDSYPRRATLEETTIPALPMAREIDDAEKHPGSVVFLGALVERKGFHLVLDSWPHVRALRPDATLTIVGKGPLEDRAKAAAAADPSVTVLVDPSRRTIFSVLDAARTLVLPSQASWTWREQVGLPIVEGLASGCSIVTTAETGLADWLNRHGHSVLPSAADAPEIAGAIVAQLDADRPASSVLADLPEVDGRLEADRWLFRTG